MNKHKIAAVTAGILLLFAGRLGAQTYTLSPPPFLEVRTLAGAIIPNGCVWTYAAGTTTPIATYLDTAGTQNGNPIVADSYGRFVAYLLPGTNYKFTYEATPCSAPSTHGTVLKTQDNIQGVPASSNNVDVGGTAGEALTAGSCAYLSDGSGAKTQGQWYKCDAANAYSSTTATVGIPIAAIAASTTGTFRLAGQVTGLSSLTVGAPYYVSGTAGALTVTAQSYRRFVGTADSTTSIIVSADPPPWLRTSIVVASAVTGQNNNYDPGGTIALGYQHTYIRYVAVADTSYSGFVAGFDGQLVTIHNSGAGGILYFLHNSASSSAGNKLFNIATTGNTPIAANGSATYQYSVSDSVWVLISHDQGAWITPTFAAGNFSGSGTMAWTLTAPDVAAFAWRLDGRTVTVAVQLATTTVVAPLASVLQILNTAWGGFTAAKIMVSHAGFVSDNGTLREATFAVIDGTHIGFARSDGLAWTAAADNTSTYGEIVFEVG